MWRFRFSRQVAAGFVSVLVVLSGTAVASLFGFHAALDRRDELIRGYARDLLSAERLRFDAEELVATSRGYLLRADPRRWQAMRDAQQGFRRSLAEFRAAYASQDGDELLGRIDRAAGAYLAVMGRLAAPVPGEATLPEELRESLLDDLAPHRLALQEATQLLRERRAWRYEQAVAAERRTSTSALRSAVGAMSLAALASVVLAVAFGRKQGQAYQERQRALEEAQRAVAARDELLGVVAHDLRSPLGAILIKAGLIRRSDDPASTRRHGAALEGIAARMELLIRSLLDTASLDHGRLAVEAAPSPVRPLLQEIEEMFREVAEKRGQELVISPADPSLTAMADRDRLMQVLSNLVGNALKFTPGAGRVTIGAEARPTDVLFSVTDTGPGIAPEHLPRIFDRFWKAEPGGKKGTGLGLYIARGLVEAHGGRIWVESNEGQGTTFRFTVPRPAPATAANEAPDGAAGLATR